MKKFKHAIKNKGLYSVVGVLILGSISLVFFFSHGLPLRRAKECVDIRTKADKMLNIPTEQYQKAYKLLKPKAEYCTNVDRVIQKLEKKEKVQYETESVRYAISYTLAAYLTKNTKVAHDYADKSLSEYSALSSSQRKKLVSGAPYSIYSIENIKSETDATKTDTRYIIR
jgi:hypothetical protein